MKYLNVLALSMQFLLFANVFAENYSAITLSSNQYNPLDTKTFTIKDGKFVYPRETNQTTYFNSLEDFDAHVINESSSHWANFEYTLHSFVPSKQYKNIGFGDFSLRTVGGSSHGKLVLGKSIANSTLEKLSNSILVFEGSSISQSAEFLSIKVSPQSGIITGVMGEYIIESAPVIPKISDSYNARIYSLQSDNTKTLVGTLMVNMYGENDFVLAGGYVLFGADRDLVYLELVTIE